MRLQIRILVVTAAVCALTAPVRTQTRGTPAASIESYHVTPHPMNATVTCREAAGEVRFDVSGETLAIHVSVSGVAAGIEHWQHVHGFKDKDNRKGNCPTAAADVNHDGIIDVTETEPVAGTTMAAQSRSGRDASRDGHLPTTRCDSAWPPALGSALRCERYQTHRMKRF